MHRMWLKWKRETKDFFVESSLFEKFGLRYLGPIDGHNIDELIKNLEFAKNSDGPILLHVLTKKGLGLEAALKAPRNSTAWARSIQSRAKAGSPPRHAAQLSGCLRAGARSLRPGRPADRWHHRRHAERHRLGSLAAVCPHQFFDVGIAEEHAVLFAAGMAAKGLKPVCAIYSTFLQRAYDPIIHDVCLQTCPWSSASIAPVSPQRRPHASRPV